MCYYNKTSIYISDNPDPNDVLVTFFEELSVNIRHHNISQSKLMLASRLFMAYMFDDFITEGILYNDKETEKFLFTGWYVHEVLSNNSTNNGV